MSRSIRKGHSAPRQSLAHGRTGKLLTGPQYRMKSKIFREITKQSALKDAWAKVYENGISSRSYETQKEIKSFQPESDRHIRSIQRRLRNDSYQFQPSIGKKIPKKTKGDFRPLVIAPIETRIIQRAVLDYILDEPKLKDYIETPHSFGGVRKSNHDDPSPVAAAIRTALEAKANNLAYVRCADISSFFTRIRKSSVRSIISSTVPDSDFLKLFDECISVELSNLEKLGSDANRFPRGDLGVAQGSSLSPMLGNILLHRFDEEMNQSGCRCIRYIDDILILGPSEKAVSARFKHATSLLKSMGMEFSKSKSSFGVQNFDSGFSFLGIELISGLIRPDGQSIGNFKQKMKSIVDDAILNMTSPGKTFDRRKSLIPTLERISGTVNGWGKHYRFCNDEKTFENIDHFVDTEIRRLLGAYTRARSKGSISARHLLGVVSLGEMERLPLKWPTKSPGT